jgi:hypothetical protein
MSRTTQTTQKVATTVHLVTQAPTSKTEVKLYYEIRLRVPSVNTTSLGIDHVVIKQSSSPYFQQEAAALMRLFRLCIYLFIYF